MRILTVTLGYPKYRGDSTAPFMEAIVRGLAGEGHDVDVVLPFHPHFEQQDADGVRFFPYRYSPVKEFAPWGFGQTFNQASAIRIDVAALTPLIVQSLRRALIRRVSVDHYDLIHAHWVVPNGWLASNVAKRRGIPIVVTLHGTDVAMGERHRILRRLCARAFQRADAVTATSNALRVRAVALGARPDVSTTVYVGVDTERFSPRSPDPRLRRELGADDGTFLVVGVGRLAAVKGFEYLIAAAAQLDGVAIAIVGDGELRDELELRAQASGGKVRVVAGVPHDRIPEVMSAADAVVVPSVVDPAGRVDSTTSTALEALACGRPLVATLVGGIPEVVLDGENGLLVAQKDANALGDAIARLQRDELFRQQLSRRARAFAVQRLSWKSTIDAFEETYGRVVAARENS